MASRFRPIDAADPRAPTQEEWDALTEDEREQVLLALPDEVPIDIMAPEGDEHRKAKNGPLDTLDRYFRRIGRRVYLSSELAVYYPGAKRIVPDLMAVADADTIDRTKWVVSAEKKGLDWVLEAHVKRHSRKDHERNVAVYAALGIPEYFIFDARRGRLVAYRLPTESARVYEPIPSREGRFTSRVLGLDIVVEGTKLRFWSGTAPLEETGELVTRLGSMVDELIAKKEEAERLNEDTERFREEAARARAEIAIERAAREEAQRRVAETQRRVAELEAELRRRQ